MRCARTALLLAPILVAACAGNPDRHTLAELRDVEPDVTEVQVENSLDQAMLGYRKFLEEAPESSLTPEAMRRLADLKLEKEYGILGDGELVELPAPEATAVPADAGSGVAAAAPGPRASQTTRNPNRTSNGARPRRRDDAVGREPRSRTARRGAGAVGRSAGGHRALRPDPRRLSDTTEHNDQVLYQKARAYDELGRTDEAIAVIERLIAEYPHSRHIDEVQFRRAEYFFTRKKYFEAEQAYSADHRNGRRLRLLRAGPVQARLGVLQAGAPRRSPAAVRRAARLQGFHRIRLRSVTRTRPTSGGSRTPTGSSVSASRASVAPRSWRSTSPRMDTGATRIASTATSVSSTSRSSATTTPPRPTRRSSSSIPCTGPHPTSACAWSRSTRRAASRSWCSNRRRSSRPATGCSPSTGVTSTSTTRRRSSAT